MCHCAWPRIPFVLIQILSLSCRRKGALIHRSTMEEGCLPAAYLQAVTLWDWEFIGKEFKVWKERMGE
jgi:hypothetical protein